MSLGVNRPLSSSFWGVELAPSPCKPLCCRILLKTCDTQRRLSHQLEPAARTLPAPGVVLSGRQLRHDLLRERVRGDTATQRWWGTLFTGSG